MDRKVIDDIVWYIPFKKLRNALRTYLLSIADVEYSNESNNDTKYYSNPIEEYFLLKNRRKSGEDKRRSFDIKDDTDIDYLINYQILHKLKEIELKNKIKNGKKVKVCFLMTSIAKFYFDSIYKEMIKSDIFEPFILFTYEKNKSLKSDDFYLDLCIKNFNLLKSQGYNLKMGIDLQTFNIIPFENFEIDILFYCAQYLNSFNTEMTNVFLNINYLTCYIPYGMDTINHYDYHYNNKYINTAWKVFADSKSSYYEFLDYSIHYGFNCILSGYPKLDKYTGELSKLPKKIDNGKPIVIYAPHHSIRNKFTINCLSTFHLYYKYFLNLVKQNPHINFVFKPHPSLHSKVEINNIMKKDEYLNYYNEWNNLDNGLCIADGDYINLFKKSSLLITDSGSFIGEYLPSKNPCIYLVNPERDQNTYMDSFSSLGRTILETYYLAHNEEEIQHYFDDIMKMNKDTKKNERLKILEEVFINIGNCGKFIKEYLQRILTN